MHSTSLLHDGICMQISSITHDGICMRKAERMMEHACVWYNRSVVSHGPVSVVSQSVVITWFKRGFFDFKIKGSRGVVPTCSSPSLSPPWLSSQETLSAIPIGGIGSVTGKVRC